MGRAKAKHALARSRWALGRGQNVKYCLNSIPKLSSKIFYTCNKLSMCVFTNKDTKHIRRDFLSVDWVMP